MLAEKFLGCDSRSAGKGKSHSEASHSARCQRATSKTHPSERARGSRTPGSCNGLFSVGFPTGAWERLTRSYELATRFLHSSSHSAVGSSTAHLCNFSRVSNELSIVKPGLAALAGAQPNFLIVPEVVCFVKLSGFFRPRLLEQLLDPTRSCLVLQVLRFLSITLHFSFLTLTEAVLLCNPGAFFRSRRSATS